VSEKGADRENLEQAENNIIIFELSQHCYHYCCAGGSSSSGGLYVAISWW
jgi:hypothetical protein